jgi:hypothetical protein
MGISSSGGFMVDSADRQQRGPSLLKVTGSVLASFFGVQSSRQHQEDFTRGRPAAYILIGLAATLLFILALYGLVQLVVGLAA